MKSIHHKKPRSKEDRILEMPSRRRLGNYRSTRSTDERRLEKVQEKRGTRAFRFYRTCPWDKWWDEFLNSRNPDGTLQYKTAWEFSRVKSHDRFQQKVIWWAIGPKPSRYPAAKRQLFPVKWLGDWQEARAQRFYYSTEKVQALQKVLVERQTALEAARGVAGITLDWVAKWAKWSEQVSNHFSHLILVQGMKPELNYRRARQFIALQSSCQEMQMRALGSYLRCHGVGEDDVSILAQMAAVGAQAALRGVEAGKSSAADNPVMRSMMEMFARKAEIYRLPMPDGEEEREIEVQVEKK